MKKKFHAAALAATITLTMTACSSKEQRLAEYAAYLQAAHEQTEKQAEAKPIIDAKWTDSGGNPMTLTVHLPQQFQPVQQIKNDEWIQFWGNMAPALVNTAATVGSQALNSYYSYKNNKSMWDAIGDSFGSGLKLDSGGGDVTLTGSANQVKMTGRDGSQTASGLGTSTIPAEEPILEEPGEFVPNDPPDFPDGPIGIPGTNAAE